MIQDSKSAVNSYLNTTYPLFNTRNIFLILSVANCSWMSENILVYEEGEFWLSFYNMICFFLEVIF